jgi:cyclopropane-fatty-acyl-phospholipid synthase
VLRRAIRSRVEGLVRRFDDLTAEEWVAREAAVVATLECGPITINSDDANRQHYELPPAFFERVLGPRLKYSCCLWPPGVTTLGEAEESMLALTAERACLADGQDILDLGCGWGSLALWAAESFPRSRVTAISNSHAQGSFIKAHAQRRGLANVSVSTAEVGSFEPRHRFDRIVSIEMLEHVRNHKALFARTAQWLKPEGTLFVHVFCHRRYLYTFETDGVGGWMAEHFFSGGLMPSYDYLAHYQDHLKLDKRWRVGGLHYARTLRTWLDRLDEQRDAVWPLLEATYGIEAARLWFAYWRAFFVACEETFALGGGREYFVGHYLFRRR